MTVPGLPMPKLGLGTWQLRGAEGQAAVERALAMGYRHLDTAEMYGNEEAVGAALAASGVPRADVFLTSKVWVDHLAPDAMRAACEGSLARLGVDALDLYLVHWPAAGMDVAAVAATLVSLQEAGLTRAVGVSNFPPGLLRRALATGAPLRCVQVEYHVGLSQERLLAVARPSGMALTAYSPLGQGKILEDPTLARIARAHDATPGGVALAWLLRQENVAAIPKAAREETQRANLGALALAGRLTPEDVAALDALPKDRRFVNPAFAPDWDA